MGELVGLCTAARAAARQRRRITARTPSRQRLEGGKLKPASSCTIPLISHLCRSVVTKTSKRRGAQKHSWEAFLGGVLCVHMGGLLPLLLLPLLLQQQPLLLGAHAREKTATALL